jgi:hypothetical protein
MNGCRWSGVIESSSRRAYCCTPAQRPPSLAYTLPHTYGYSTPDMAAAHATCPRPFFSRKPHEWLQLHREGLATPTRTRHWLSSKMDPR